MNQEHVANTSQLSIEHSMSDEGINDIRRVIEQCHSPIAYFISFGLDQAGVRYVIEYEFNRLTFIYFITLK
jgi:hypothetical protein